MDHPEVYGDVAPDTSVLRPSNVIETGRRVIQAAGLIQAPGEPDQLDILRELDVVVAGELDRHNRMRQPWVPADFLPIDERTGTILNRLEPGSEPLLSTDAQAAMLVNLLTEDNLPGYHRIIANNFGRDGALGAWTEQWTTEEDSHAYAMRSYLDLTRQIDPATLERERFAHMLHGYSVEKDPLHTLAYVTFQELATRVSHRQTGLKSGEPILDKMLERIAKDENLHMLFYRNLVAAALAIAPNQTMQAITDEVMGFEMPGASIANFKTRALRIANAGIYDPINHLREVVTPVLRHWKIFERDDFTGYGARARDALAAHLETMEAGAAKFDEQRASGRLGQLITRMEARATS